MTDADEIASMDAVTELLLPAGSAAQAAAAAAGVRVRELVHLGDFAAVCRLFEEIWRTEPQNPLVTTELLRALTKAGNYLAGAFDGDRLVGACVAFFGAPTEETMHSHIAGVAPVAAGRNVGYALKLHQRAWALTRRVTAIAWTFDPLVARNAYFNLAKLGATAQEYLPNFYGGMRDGMNSGDDTDRLLVRWNLAAPATAAPAMDAAMADAGVADAGVVLDRTADGLPAPRTSHNETVLVAVPPDIEALRAADPGRAKEWRAALRDVLGGLLADGARVTGFDRAGWYVVTREGGR